MMEFVKKLLISKHSILNLLTKYELFFHFALTFSMLLQLMASNLSEYLESSLNNIHRLMLRRVMSILHSFYDNMESKSHSIPLTFYFQSMPYTIKASFSL